MASPRTRPCARRATFYPSLPGLVAPAILFIIGLALLFVNYGAYTSLPEALSLRQECRMSRMWPSYELHHPPSPSGQGKKYRLYLYRENPPGRGAQTAPRRKPALFIPGNAGSYGQVRSVASWSWHEYQNEVREVGAEQAVETDWWSIDFNEDFSALHSTTLEGQSIYVNEALEYITGLYRPSSRIVPLVAHSMGGIVARLALLQANHPTVSPVKTLITLSTPHSIPPAPIERDMERIYQLINNDVTTARKQRGVLLVSLSGGILDTQLPSEYSTLPPRWASNVLHHYTSDLPVLWSNVDHLAMMWCDQLRRRIAVGVAGEMLSVPEESMSQRKQRWSETLQIDYTTSEDSKLHRWTADARLFTLLPNETINFDDAASGYGVFNLLTTLRPLEDILVFVCRSNSGEKRTCRALAAEAFDLVPSSSADGSWIQFPKAEKHYEAAGEGLRVLKIDIPDMVRLGWDTISVHECEEAKGWWEAGWSEGEASSIGMQSSEGLAFNIKRVPLTAHSPLLSLRMPQVFSTLFVYDFTLSSSCQSHDGPARFAPMVHIYHSETGDGRWYPSLDNSQSITLPVSIHAISPYMPTSLHDKTGLAFELYASTEGQCRAFDALKVKINWSKSVGLWLSRYRLGVVSWMTAILSISARLAMREYAQTNSMLNPTRSILQSMPRARGGSGLLLALLIGLAVLQQALVNLGRASRPLSPSVRDLLFGLAGKAPSAFGLRSSDLGLTLLLGVGLAIVTWTTLAIIAIALHVLTSLAARLFGFFRLGGFLIFDHDLSIISATEHNAEKPAWKPSTFLTLVVAVAMVKLYIPYQFVFLALVLIQILNVIRAKVALQDASKEFNEQRLRLRLSQNTLVLLHLFLLLPLRGPSLIIFVRNFLAGYASTSSTFFISNHQVGFGFGEDHGILRILPVLLLVQVTSTGRLIELPPQQEAGRLVARAIEWAYLLLAVCTLAWGIRYPYLLYDISLWIFWLILAGHYLSRWGVGSPESAVTRKNEEEDEDSVPLTTRPATEDHGMSAGRDGDGGDVERKETAMPFSIPDELMPGGSSYEAAETPDDLAQRERSANQQHSTEVQSESTESLGRIPVDAADSNDKAKVSLPASDVDSLLIEYLSLLDDYLQLRETFSSTLSRGVFNLSSAQMAAGGWGTTAGARRSLWDARLTREVEVDTQEWVLRDVERSLPEEMQTEAFADEMLNEKEDTPSGLRRRKPTSASTSEKHAEATQQANESSSAKDEKAEKTRPGESSKPAPLPPSALYQFSALPSAKLRRARQDFCSALEVIVQGSARAADRKMADSENEKTGEADGARGPALGLVQMSIKLQRLEEAIRLARKGDVA